MPAKKGKSTSAASSKRGRPKKPVTKKTSAKSASKKNDESTSNAAGKNVRFLCNQKFLQSQKLKLFSIKMEMPLKTTLWCQTQKTQ